MAIKLTCSLTHAHTHSPTDKDTYLQKSPQLAQVLNDVAKAELMSKKVARREKAFLDDLMANLVD